MSLLAWVTCFWWVWNCLLTNSRISNPNPGLSSLSFSIWSNLKAATNLLIENARRFSGSKQQDGTNIWSVYPLVEHVDSHKNMSSRFAFCRQERFKVLVACKIVSVIVVIYDVSRSNSPLASAPRTGGANLTARDDGDTDETACWLSPLNRLTLGEENLSLLSGWVY